ncbi:hypothetical protein P5W99_05605 [Paraburkholderia sp. A3BS-1L]|uniref:hypothetical protein n=1 Tax=Paraburkholderia sp. A3BS-1L TaxID=3028375 RepID=UPI003DA90C52
MPNELHSAFSMNVSALMAEPHDDASRAGAVGDAADIAANIAPDIAPDIAPLPRDLFEIHGLAGELDHAAPGVPAAPANAAGDQPPPDAQWSAAAELAPVPMRVRYGTHFSRTARYGANDVRRAIASV